VKEGDRVITPDGPGTIVSFWHSWEGLRRRVDIGVLLDQGQEWRKLYRPTELEAEEWSSRAENQTEALAVERDQERRHGEP
jgi:hypothetical protein